VSVEDEKKFKTDYKKHPSLCQFEPAIEE